MSIVLSMFAVFGSGILVGAYAYHSYSVKTVSATVESPARKSPEQWRREYVGMLSKRLTLDEKQVGSLNAILDDTRNQFKQLKDRHKSEADQLKTTQTNKIRTMLNPTQLAEYEKVREERDRKLKAEQAAKEQSAKAGN
ncbi:MAG: hypothetical protein ICV68_09835 [Pyrinomonadaceae bacterium]|nr:hypothetical protein [Pyrinomonadaceae bacterium]